MGESFINMITKEQAIALGNGSLREDIHYTGKHDCARHIGPRGGITENVTRVRPSGKCQVWKTRPDEFKLPVKYGMYESSYITHRDASDWHLASECSLAQTDAAIENHKTVIETKTRLDMSGPFPIVYTEKVYGYPPQDEPSQEALEALKWARNVQAMGGPNNGD